MTIYKVWDELSGDEENAHTIEDDSPEYAAEVYAEEDEDGHCDGLYESPHPINVRAPDGTLHKFAVVGKISIDYRVSAREA